MPRSATPWLMLLALLPAAIAACVLAPRPAAAACEVSNLCTPSPSCRYFGTTQVFHYGLFPHETCCYQLSAPTHCELPPPPGGLPVDSFFDIFVELDLSQNGGATFSPATGTAHGVIRMRPPVGPTIETEMLQLQLSGGSLPPGVQVRESPTLASTGQMTVTPTQGGYRIDSFFDIFTELSVDGGQTWTPAAEGSSHMTISQDRATPTHASSWGRLKAYYR